MRSLTSLALSAGRALGWSAGLRNSIDELQLGGIDAEPFEVSSWERDVYLIAIWTYSGDDVCGFGALGNNLVAYLRDW